MYYIISVIAVTENQWLDKINIIFQNNTRYAKFKKEDIFLNKDLYKNL